MFEQINEVFSLCHLLPLSLRQNNIILFHWIVLISQSVKLLIDLNVKNKKQK